MLVHAGEFQAVPVQVTVEWHVQNRVSAVSESVQKAPAATIPSFFVQPAPVAETEAGMLRSSNLHDPVDVVCEHVAVEVRVAW